MNYLFSLVLFCAFFTAFQIINSYFISTPANLFYKNKIRLSKLFATDSKKSYVRCKTCRASYVISEKIFVENNKTLRCSVCESVWNQSKKDILKTNFNDILIPISNEEINNLKFLLKSDQQSQSKVMNSNPEIYITRIPTNMTENDLTSLFSEYGVTRTILIKDHQTKVNKGYGFMQVMILFHFLSFYININIQINSFFPPFFSFSFLLQLFVIVY